MVAIVGTHQLLLSSHQFRPLLERSFEKSAIGVKSSRIAGLTLISTLDVLSKQGLLLFTGRRIFMLRLGNLLLFFDGRQFAAAL